MSRFPRPLKVKRLKSKTLENKRYVQESTNKDRDQKIGFRFVQRKDDGVSD